MGTDGIAISADGARLYYCSLGSRKLYSVAVDALCDRSIDDVAVASTVIDEGDRGGASDGLESDADGCVYSTNYEHNAVLRRNPAGVWETVVHDPRLLWPDTLSLATDGFMVETGSHKSLTCAETCADTLIYNRCPDIRASSGKSTSRQSKYNGLPQNRESTPRSANFLFELKHCVPLERGGGKVQVIGLFAQGR